MPTAGFVGTSWPEEHKRNHRTSTDSIRLAMCDVWCCVTLGQKNTRCIIALRPIRFASRGAISVYGSQTKILERRTRFRWVVLEALFITFSPNIALSSMKSASKTTHRNLFRRSKIFVWGAYCFVVPLGQKNTRGIIAHRPNRFACRCAISVLLVPLGQKNTRGIIAPRPIRFAWRCAMSGVV